MSHRDIVLTWRCLPASCYNPYFLHVCMGCGSMWRRPKENMASVLCHSLPLPWNGVFIELTNWIRAASQCTLRSICLCPTSTGVTRTWVMSNLYVGTGRFELKPLWLCKHPEPSPQPVLGCFLIFSLWVCVYVHTYHDHTGATEGISPIASCLCFLQTHQVLVTAETFSSHHCVWDMILVLP